MLEIAFIIVASLFLLAVALLMFKHLFKWHTSQSGVEQRHQKSERLLRSYRQILMMEEGNEKRGAIALLDAQVIEHYRNEKQGKMYSASTGRNAALAK